MYQTIRDSIISLVHPSFATANPTIPIYYDNQSYDENNVPERYVTFEIKFYDGEQLYVRAIPGTRTYGFVYVTVYSRGGIGNRDNLVTLSWFAENLGYASPGTVRLQAPQPAGSDRAEGWFWEEIKIPFYADMA